MSSFQYVPVQNPNTMADAPERYFPPSNPEAVNAHGYYSPGSAAQSDQAPEVAYTDGAQGAHEKDAATYGGEVESSPKENWRKRQVFGLPILTFIIVALIVVAAVIGGVVGGVVGSRSGKSNVEEGLPGSPVLDIGASSSSAAIDASATTEMSSTATPSSTSSATKPTRTQACPEYDVDVRSDFWHTITNYYQDPILYMSGAYNAADNNSVIKMVSETSSVFSTKLEWQFLKVKEPHPLAKLGCESQDLEVTLYRIACRSTEPNINIRLGLDPVTWDRFSNRLNTTEELLRLRLAPDDNEDL